MIHTVSNPAHPNGGRQRGGDPRVATPARTMKSVCRHEVPCLLAGVFVHGFGWLLILAAITAATPYLLARIQRAVLRARLRHLHSA